MILGEISKIKKFDLNELEKMLEIKFDDVVDYDFLLLMGEYKKKYNIEIGFYLDKDNKINSIFFGSYNDLPIDDAEDYDVPQGKIFIICNNDNFHISNMDKAYLRKKHLSMLCRVAYLNGINGAEVGILDVGAVKIIDVSSVEFINKYGIEERINEIAEKFRDLAKKGFNTDENAQRAVIVGVGRRGEDIDVCLNELQGLAEANNIEVVGRFFQKRKIPDKAYHISIGKLEELSNLIAEKQANVAIFDDELSANKIRNLEDALDVKVIDRANVILDIFANRAKSNEGRLQVKLARMKYNITRVGAFQNTASKGLGMRGVGETQMELNRRILKNKIYTVEGQIKEMKKQRDIRRMRRKENNEKIVALVGYTNAGKSTILNKITDAQAFAENMLFATLDTMTRECYLDSSTKVLLTDTVGFIDKLPHELIDAFSATLEESVESNLLLLVVDISDPECQRKYEVVISTLEKIKATQIPSVVVLNKSDAQKIYQLNTSKETIMISAKSGEGIPQLKKLIKSKLF